MKSKKTLGIVALAMVAILGVGFISAYGFGKGFGFLNPDFSDEEKESIVNAIESGDYEIWASIKRTQISEEKFEELRTRHQERQEFRNRIQEARESGDFEAMQQIKEQEGIGRRIHKRNINFGGCPFAE